MVKETMLDDLKRENGFLDQIVKYKEDRLKKGVEWNDLKDRIVVNTIMERIIELWDITEILGLYYTFHLCYQTKLTISL